MPHPPCSWQTSPIKYKPCTYFVGEVCQCCNDNIKIWSFNSFKLCQTFLEHILIDLWMLLYWNSGLFPFSSRMDLLAYILQILAVLSSALQFAVFSLDLLFIIRNQASDLCPSERRSFNPKPLIWLIVLGLDYLTFRLLVLLSFHWKTKSEIQMGLEPILTVGSHRAGFHIKDEV